MPTSSHEHLLSSDDESSPQKQLDQIPNTPLFPLNFKELFQVALTLIKSSSATAISLVSGFITGLICLRFAGKYGTPAELAGVTLGFTWSNILCIGFLSSINQGFSVFAAQLYGAQKHRDLGVLFQRNLCVVTACLIPLLLTLYFAESVLLSFGLNVEVSKSTGTFLISVMPSLIGLTYFDCFRTYLMAQNYFYIQPIIQGSTALLHILWCYVFVDKLDMTVSGVGIAKSITDLTSLSLISLFVIYKRKEIESWISWQKECLEKWLSHLKMTLVIGANTYVEWISFEASLVIIGFLNEEHILAAHGVAMSLTATFFTLPCGNSYAMQAYLGNAVGEGSKNKAQKITVVGLAINFIMTGANVAIMIIFVDSLTDFFTDDAMTKEILKTMFSIARFVHVADTFVTHLTGALRCIGKEAEVLRNFILCYPIVMLNCEWIFGVALGYGYVAVWLSIGFGMYLMIALMVRMLWNLDWDFEIKKIGQKVGNHKQDEPVYIEMTDR